MKAINVFAVFFLWLSGCVPSVEDRQEAFTQSGEFIGRTKSGKEVWTYKEPLGDRLYVIENSVNQSEEIRDGEGHITGTRTIATLQDAGE